MADIGAAFDDFFTSLGGGETSGQKSLREKQAGNIDTAFEQYRGEIGDQYTGASGAKAAEIAQLQRALNDPMLANSSAPGDVAARERLRKQIIQLTQELDQMTSYDPMTYNPQTEYDVSGYTPERITAESEAARAALTPDLYAAPDYESAAMQGDSEAARAQADAESLAASKAALGSLQDVYQQGGMTAADRARQEQIRASNAQQERAAREAILANAAERGQATSGTNTMALLNAAQGTANRNRAQSMDVESLAEQRALQAMRDAGALGRGLATDGFGRQFATGSAQDEINRYNTQGSRDVQAAERAAADAYTGWNRDVLGRDTDRATNANMYNANAADRAGAFLADANNTMNQWGGDANNTARQNFANAWTNARMYEANRNNANVGGFNNQQNTVGNSWLNQMGMQNNLIANQPVMDPGQFVENLGKFGQMGYDLFTDPGNDKEVIGGMINGGGGSSGAGAAMAFI